MSTTTDPSTTTYYDMTGMDPVWSITLTVNDEMKIEGQVRKGDDQWATLTAAFGMDVQVDTAAGPVVVTALELIDATSITVRADGTVER